MNMFFATRFINAFRSVLPYAQYVTLALNLGYGAYTAYSWYQEYLKQMDLDARNGFHRTQEEVIELIVRPRRRRRTAMDDSQAQQTNNSDNDHFEQQSNRISSSQSMFQIIDVTETNESSNSNNTENLVSLNRTVEIIDISEVPESTNNVLAIELTPRPSGSQRSPIVIDEVEETDEILSTVSESLESTDSNNGIVRDMYNECFICATSLDDPNKQVATLPFCMHPFHKSCLDGVLKWHQKCPVCDFNIFSPI